MPLDTYQAGFIVCGLAGATIAAFCYGSYAGDLEGYTLLALTGALSGIAYWLLTMNEHLGLPNAREFIGRRATVTAAATSGFAQQMQARTRRRIRPPRP